MKEKELWNNEEKKKESHYSWPRLLGKMPKTKRETLKVLYKLLWYLWERTHVVVWNKWSIYLCTKQNKNCPQKTPTMTLLLCTVLVENLRLGPREQRRAFTTAQMHTNNNFMSINWNNHENSALQSTQRYGQDKAEMVSKKHTSKKLKEKTICGNVYSLQQQIK